MTPSRIFWFLSFSVAASTDDAQTRITSSSTIVPASICEIMSRWPAMLKMHCFTASFNSWRDAIEIGTLPPMEMERGYAWVCSDILISTIRVHLLVILPAPTAQGDHHTMLVT